MPARSFLRGRVGVGAVAILVMALLVTLAISHARTPGARASGSGLLQLSSDPYTNTSSQHQTEVEPDSFSNGATIVMAFQAGRFSGAGSSNIGWATSTDGGATWTSGFLPDITVYAGGPWDRVSDPAVAYDSVHRVWMIASLALSTSGPNGVVVSRSTDGGLTWQNPVTVSVGSANSSYDKDWVVCDNWPHPFRGIMQPIHTYYGRCYVEWDDAANGQTVEMSTSKDGGLTWSSPNGPHNVNPDIGGQPLVQPNGNVVVPIIDGNNPSFIAAYTSHDGGQSWSSVEDIAPIEAVSDGGFIRGGVLPSAEVDASGRVYIVWSDARFEPNSGTQANDIVMTTSTDGVTWSAVQRIPIDPVSPTGVDHLLAGIAVDKGTSGSSAHLGVMYYYVPQGTSCTVATCQLDVGFVSSTNGGSTWSAPTQLAGPMNEAWLANTGSGYMVGDYFSASFSAGKCYPVFSVASQPPSSGVFAQATYTWTGGLTIAGGTRSGAGSHVYGAPSHGVVVGKRRTAN